MLTTESVLALAPDDASAKAARGLLAPSKWPLRGADERARRRWLQRRPAAGLGG
jgi:hypothetical protein